jgi:hypothetical protein
MHDRFGDVSCDGCSTVSGQISGHIGGFVGPRLALMFEAQANVQQISMGTFVEDDEFLTQSAAMVAAQYWLTPQLWVKGGIGVANLQVNTTFTESVPENGLALMGAVLRAVLVALHVGRSPGSPTQRRVRRHRQQHHRRQRRYRHQLVLGVS